MAISTYLAVLSVKTSESSEFEQLYPIKDFPDLIGTPNNLETTTLSDAQQTFIPGIKQSDTMTFTSNYTKEDFTKGKGLEGNKLTYKLEFVDGSVFQWEGQHTMGIPGKGVDEVIEMTTNILASTSPEPVEA